MSPLISSPHEPGPSTSSFSTKAGTVCVLGLSGPEQEKGALGIGKSTLCNRMVRPNFVDFSGEHINCLSQADFLCSPVINGNHWLYWGEVELEREWKMEANSPLAPRRVTHLRVLEQTVFVDDEGFEPLGTTFRRGKVGEDYLRKALALQLESAGKVAYQSRDQLGQEGDFVWQELPGGQINVDAFCVLFDVSFVPGRCPQRQSAFVASLLLGASKTKKPVFLVGTKFDECSAEGKAEWQKILGRRELKNAAQNVQMVEISALENVNVAELVWAIGDCLERGKPWSQRRIPPYPDSLQMRRIQIEQINRDFRALLDWALPREEYLVKKGEISWSRLLADGTLSTQPAYIRFMREFGPKAAKCAFNEHLRASREWWFDHELSVRLCSLRDVLRRMFSRSFLCQIRWPRLVKEIEVHPEFDTFFQPLGRSLDRFSTINDQQWDERLPSEMLQKGESERIFAELQRELLDEIALERQADKFRQILAQKEAVIPGRSFADAKVMVEELGAFEQALPPGTALRIYEQYQEEIIQGAQRELTELLMEQIELFVDIVVLWRSKHPELPPLIGLDGKENAAVHSILMEDKRYRMLNGLPDLRATLIGQFASFLSLPLERHCPGGSLCADLGASVLLQRHIQNSSSNFFAIELSLHGPPQFTSQLLNAIRCHTGPPPCPVFLHNGLSVRFSTPRPHSPSSLSSLCSSSSSSCPSPSAGPSLSARIPSQLFLFSTLDEAQQHFLSANLANPHQLISRPSVGGICPLVVLIGNMAKMDGHNGQVLQQIGNQLADHLGGMFKMLPLADGPEGGQCMFSRTHLDLLLHEICALQLDSGHSDLRVRVSSMCGDSPSVESILSPLLDHSHLPIDHSGRKFYFDAHLPIGAEMLDESGDPSISPKREMPSPTPSQSLLANLRLPPQNRCKARVCISIGSFHQWIMAKWPLQSVQGHLLIFSPSRRASWRQAQCAAKLLLDSVGHGANGEMGEEEDQERKAMGRSIFLVALADANSIDEKRSSRILAKAEHFANRIGAMFASFRSNGRIATGRNGQHPHQYFLEFFRRILQNPFPPAEYYTITSRRLINLEGGEDWHSIAQSQFGICSTLTGSAETLMTERSEGGCFGEERETKNAQWRRKSKQSRIALVGSPPPPAAMIPPVLRNDSQLSRTTAMTQWTNGSGLTTSTLTEARGENSRGSDSTTRTPLASAKGARGERPHSAVILPSNLEEEVQQIEANQNARTPRRLEKLISSFVQFRSTTPVIPLTADDQNKEEGAMGGPAVGSRRARMQRMASEQQMAKKILHTQIAKNNSIGLPSSAELLSQSMDSLLIMENSRKGQKNEKNKLEINGKWGWTGRRRRSRSEMPQKWNGEEQFPSPFFVRRILPSNWQRKRQMPRMLTGRKGQWGNGSVGAGKCERTMILDLEAEDDLEAGKKANLNSPSPHPQLPSSGHRFAWLRSPRSQSRSRGQNAKCSPFSATNNPSQSALSSSTLSLDATPKNGKQQQNSSLAECCAQSREGLPPFMVKCVRTIEENGGLETEGLYRVPGNQMDVERMFQKGGAGNFNKIPVHAVATGLKRFLDGLAESLIPEKMHSAILNVFEGENGIGEAIDGKKRNQIVAAIRCNLPLENWRVLCFLTGHLRRVAECSAENSMDLRNLAKVWSPTLFRPNFESFEAMASSMAKFEMATFLLLFTNCGKQRN